MASAIELKTNDDGPPARKCAVLVLLLVFLATLASLIPLGGDGGAKADERYDLSNCELIFYPLMYRLRLGRPFTEENAVSVYADIAAGDAFGVANLGAKTVGDLARCYEIGTSWLLPSAQEEHAEAQYALGHFLFFGRVWGANRWNDEAADRMFVDGVHWLKEAHENAYKPATTHLAVILEYVFSCTDPEFASKCADDRATYWLPPARDRAAFNKEWLEWLKDQAEGGYPSFQLLLARMFRDGKQVPKDSEQAEHWYRTAAESGQNRARIELEQMMRDAQE